MSLAVLTRWLVLICLSLCLNEVVSSAPLEQYLGKHRVIVTFSAASTSPERLELHRQIEQYQCEFDDRELIHVDLIAGSNQYGLLSQHFTVKGHHFSLLLIGKDGDLKMHTDTPNLKPVFVLIDKMPMRQKERGASVCQSEDN
ncbi:MAG: DUF4174 domain-containing protein [Oxalobacteraceae bacterium]|jgi:hypothetical protein|nr:DUF4174 domain-containing protein [Oxalobacteraceae bacterium]